MTNDWQGVQDPDLRHRVQQVRRNAETRMAQRNINNLRRQHHMAVLNLASCVMGGGAMFLAGYLLGSR